MMKKYLLLALMTVFLGNAAQAAEPAQTTKKKQTKPAAAKKPAKAAAEPAKAPAAAPAAQPEEFETPPDMEQVPAEAAAVENPPAAPAKEEVAAPAAATPPAASTATPAGTEAPADGASSDNMDVTVTGEAKEEMPVTKETPSWDVSFQEIATLAKEGQTEKVLAEEIRHMTLEQQTNLVEMDSKQTLSPSLIRLPAPPFFRMEVPQNVTAANPKRRWKFQVVDQGNKVIHEVQGTEWPQTLLLTWDGFKNGAMAVQVGQAFTPLLFVTEGNGRVQRFYGDPIQMDAIQYEQDGLLRVEYGNNRLYEARAADFSPEMEPFLLSTLDLMRLRVGKPFRVTLYDDPGTAPLTQKRLEAWKTFLLDKLMINSDDITILSMPTGNRGKITSITMLAKP